LSGGVFLKRGDDLVEMFEQPYELEVDLQDLIERHPNLLAGDQVNPGAPRRWLSLSREAGLASEDDGADRWSVDHLLLDQDAIPTIVEVKRSSDSRIRRAVVGQMLDYAANAVTYWNLDRLRERFEEAVREEGREPQDDIAKLVADANVDGDEFWERAKTNLRAGRIRLVFVADRIPSELQRIVEFLNEHMSPTEVLAVEIRQYRGGGEQTLVPRMFGQTAEARQAKSSSNGRGSRNWDESTFLAETARLLGDDDAETARKMIAWSNTAFSRLEWGHGERGRFAPTLDHGSRSYAPVGVWTSGRVAFQFYWMKRWPPFDQDAKKLELLRKLNEIPGINLPHDAIAKQPDVQIALFRDDKNLNKLFDTLDWFVAEAKAT
jgi:hypothetical protein